MLEVILEVGEVPLKRHPVREHAHDERSLDGLPDEPASADEVHYQQKR